MLQTAIQIETILEHVMVLEITFLKYITAIVLPTGELDLELDLELDRELVRV